MRKAIFSTDILGKTYYHGFQEVEEIILETHNGGDRIVVGKDEYVLAESVDMIQLLPVDDKLPIRTFHKPFWKVVKQ